MKSYYRKDGDEAFWLEMPLFVERWQIYFVKKYSFDYSHLLFILLYYPSSCGSWTRKDVEEFPLGAIEDVFKYPLVAWENVCLLVEVGG